MFSLLGLVVRGALVLAVTWVALVFGLPIVRRGVLIVCERQVVHGGLCDARTREQLAAADAWVARVLRPLPQRTPVQLAVGQVRGAFTTLETVARDRLGDERVDETLRDADAAVTKLEALTSEIRGDARSKVAEVPANARDLITEVRGVLDRLLGLLGTTTRRAEDVTRAVDDTRKALDALSKVLPSEDTAATPTP